MRIHVEMREINEAYCRNPRATGPRVDFATYAEKVRKGETLAERGTDVVCSACARLAEFDVRAFNRSKEVSP